MTIKDVVKIASVFLNRNDIKEYLDGQNGDVLEQTESDLSILVDLANVVINELACSYVSARKSEDVLPKNGRVYYKDLSESPLKILSVKDKNGVEISYGYSYEYISVKNIPLVIEYEFSPKSKGLEEDVCYLENQVPARVIAYGLTAEYSIVMGEFNQAVTWHKRYTDSIAQICLPQNKKIKTRGWL